MAEDLYRNLSPDFFYDEKVIFSLQNTTIEQAKGHLILLGSNVESFLKLATLLDGSTVDFLFGVRYASNYSSTGVGRSRSNEVKKFIRGLDATGQEAIAEFYYLLYTGIMEYSEASHQCCATLFCQERNKRNFLDKADRAFIVFQKKVRKASSSTSTCSNYHQ
jgi:hypothetical protein